ncbi:hypothetical protein K439DRAFT_1615044 [Ramaria rubella]|nr:hypothetical protein K439DRAFT_1615044 [Ramaria rubella]
MPLKSGHKGPVLMYHQCQLARQMALSNCRAINADVDDVLDYMEERAKQLSIKHKRSLVWFLPSSTKEDMWSTKSIKGFLEGRKGEVTEDEKTRFEEIQAKIKQLNGVENTCKSLLDMQTFLKRKAEAWCVQKQTAPHANLAAVIQDSRLTLDHVTGELLALSQWTGVETILFAVKGKPEHSLPSFVATSEKGNNFLLHRMKKHTSDIAKEFESYVLSDVNGTDLYYIICNYGTDTSHKVLP